MTARLPLGALRIIGLAATFLYGWWLITYFRTTSLGNDSFFTYLLIALLYVFPIALLPLLGLRARQALLIALLVVAAALISALTWATIEEYTVMRSVSTGAEYYGER